MTTEKRPKKIVVVVHGIGDQTAYESVQAVVKQFCKSFDLPATVSLGQLDSSIGSQKQPLALMPPVDPHLPIDVGFTEIHWADIARQVETKGYRLEDTRHWARTLIERIRHRSENKENRKDAVAARMARRRSDSDLFATTDFNLIKIVLQEAINAISVSELFMTVFKHIGGYKPKLEKALTGYLGDVQLVTEFREIRDLILSRFEEAMEALCSDGSCPEIYIIAHSEGTVISFLGLLRALQRSAAAQKKENIWIDRVRGFVTLGSPIDKHLALWPELWGDFDFRSKPCSTPRIHWVNYYDFGDPVGFKLDTARTWLQDVGCRCFVSSDVGFSRSWLPGKAHVDYWTDRELFRHIIDNVVAASLPKDEEKGKPLARLKSKPFAVVSSFAVPYLSVFAMLMSGVFLLYRAVDEAMGWDDGFLLVMWNSFLITLLLGGVTALSRVVRFSRRWQAHLGATLFYCTAVWGFRNFLSEAAYQNITESLQVLVPTDNPGNAILIASAFIAGCGLFSRQYSLIPVLGAGFGAVTWVVGQIVIEGNGKDHLAELFLAVIALFCLWWLAAIIFDLSFIWHAYIRSNRAGVTLHMIYEKQVRPVVSQR